MGVGARGHDARAPGKEAEGRRAVMSLDGSERRQGGRRPTRSERSERRQSAKRGAA
jgi:hypothetical protein